MGDFRTSDDGAVAVEADDHGMSMGLAREAGGGFQQLMQFGEYVPDGVEPLRLALRRPVDKGNSSAAANQRSGLRRRAIALT